MQYSLLRQSEILWKTSLSGRPMEFASQHPFCIQTYSIADTCRVVEKVSLKDQTATGISLENSRKSGQLFN
jgi:hypothetical protein